jgi:hypothetical protein
MAYLQTTGDTWPYSVFPSVILSEAKDLRGTMRPLAVLQSSALWLSHTFIGNSLQAGWALFSAMAI